MKIDRLEVLALKKLVLINHALAKSLSDPIAAREQKALVSILNDLVLRADLENQGDLPGAVGEVEKQQLRIEALEAALREIADEQKVYLGYGDYDILPAMTANEAMMRARSALMEQDSVVVGQPSKP